MSEVLLKTDDLVIGHDHSLSSPLNLTIPARVGVGIIGANGSGKSTLLKTCAGLVPPLSGHYQWASKTRFGYVPQEDQVSPFLPLTVTDLLKMGVLPLLPKFGFSTQHFESLALQVLGEMEMVELRDKRVSQLSRGQRQRALIARALIGNPEVLLLDEPYSALDDSFRKKLHEVFEERKKRSGFSFFVIEHDLNRVINQVDWVMILGPHDTLCGPKSEIINQKHLSRAYGSRLHVHEENGETQIHFL